MRRRVVVTGLGIISPLGLDLEGNWQALCQGKSGIKQITKFKVDDFPIKIAGEVKGFKVSGYVKPKDIKKMDTFIHYAVACSQMALQDSGVEINDQNAEDEIREAFKVFDGVSFKNIPSKFVLSYGNFLCPG